MKLHHAERDGYTISCPSPWPAEGAVFVARILPMRTLVTGGAGFVGSHLCERLLEEANVICIDNFINSNERNIDHLLKFPNFEFIRHDINEPLDLANLPELEKFKVKFQGIQEVYHLACPTSAKNFNQYRLDTLRANSVGMINTLETALKFKARFLQASTSVVYGPRRSDKKVFREDDLGPVDLLSPRASYDEGKRFAESAVITYSQVHGLDTRIARIFRTYGPRERLFDGEMMPDFIVNALEGKELVIFGDENFGTSLTFVTDIVDGLYRLMNYPNDIGPVNLGSEEEVRLADAARQVVELTSSKSKIVFKPPLLFMTPLGLPDIRKAKEELGWLPLVRLEDGLKKTIDYTLAHKELLS
jgi:UDP-glucuronate decarboxylase